MTDLILLLAILIIPAIAHFKIKRNYNTYLNIENEKKLSGQEVARKIIYLTIMIQEEKQLDYLQMYFMAHL